MRNKKRLVALSSFGLLLAVALSPVFLQQESCEIEEPDPTALVNLELRPFHMGQELPHSAIAFEKGVNDYSVELPAHVTEAMVVAEPEVESSELTIQCIAGGTIDGHPFEQGQSWTMIELPEGNSIVQIVVRASADEGGGIGVYTIGVTRGQPDPTALANLELRPFQMGQELPYDLMTFESGVTEYTVELPDFVTEAMVVAQPVVESSELTIQCIAGGTIDGHAFEPGKDWTMIGLPEGNSVVQVVVRATTAEGGEIGMYTIHVTRVPGQS